MGETTFGRVRRPRGVGADWRRRPFDGASTHRRNSVKQNPVTIERSTKKKTIEKNNKFLAFAFRDRFFLKTNFSLKKKEDPEIDCAKLGKNPVTAAHSSFKGLRLGKTR